MCTCVPPCVTALKGTTNFCLGNVQNSYFQNVGLPPEDIPGFISTMFQLILIELVPLIFSLVFLKCSCGINLFNIFLYQQQEFGLIIGVQTAFIMECWFSSLTINSAFDMSNNFNWLKSGFVLDFGDNGTQVDWRFSQNVNLTYLTS